jgi:hypothetical protein
MRQTRAVNLNMKPQPNLNYPIGNPSHEESPFIPAGVHQILRKWWIAGFPGFDPVRCRMGLVFLLAIGMAFGARAQETIIEIIPLSSRPASEVADLIRPFLSPDGTAVASGTKLIVKTNPDNISEIHQLIDQLDQRLAQFQISILQSSRLSLAELNAQANVHGTVSDRSSSVRAKAHVYQSDSKTSGEITQQLRVMEGNAAHIEVGQAFPVPVYTGPGFGPVPLPSTGIGYQEATTGFAVIPRMAGSEVQLEVSPWSDRFNRLGGGVVNTQSAHTTIRAPLGQWVRFGGQDLSETGHGSGILSRYESTGKDTLSIYIKVDRVR